MINLRKVTIEDADYILNIRNDMKIRTTSGVNEVVSREKHRIWLNQFLQSENNFYFIGEFNNERIGVVRFQPFNNLSNISEVSISIYPQEYQHKGYGRCLLIKGIEFLKKNTNIEGIIARIRHNNETSLNFFKRNHFTLFSKDHEFLFLKLKIE
ncbi:hypothetical protein BTR23_16200 [Alkalihalophilus pseudofirmus]|uniref:GNAT family N-acetyltransferase n=1 Tax=Halalkalibacter lacteus TaxID=3090663 RepID=UPI00094C504D|nr:hypothetical protein BTR23_16200 [Alkalihalophilus pseudofirmus]